jgi:hypothetical protein
MTSTLTFAENVVDTLTEQELHELKERPLTNEYRDYNEQQLEVRTRIAQKQWKVYLDANTTMGATIRNIYEVLPLWAFYEAASSLRPTRCYGLDCAQTCRILTAINVNGQGGSSIPLANVRRVDHWTDEQKQRIIRRHERPGVFLDPLGYQLMF